MAGTATPAVPRAQLIQCLPKSFLIIPGFSSPSELEKSPGNSMEPSKLQLAQAHPTGWRFTGSTGLTLDFLRLFADLRPFLLRNLSVQSLQVQAAG